MSQPPAAASPLNTRLYNLEYPRSLGVYSTYQEVQAVVDTLADNAFPVQRTMIVGTDLKLMERVTGRKTWGKVIGQGVLSGLWMGLFLGLLLMFISQSSLAIVVTSVLMGIVFFTVWSAVSYAMTGGKRDFTSMVATIPMQYELMVEHTNAEEARRILAEAGAAPSQPTMPHSTVPGRPDLGDQGGGRPHGGPAGQPPAAGSPTAGSPSPGGGSGRPSYGQPAPTSSPAAAPSPRPSYGQPAPTQPSPSAAQRPPAGLPSFGQPDESGSLGQPNESGSFGRRDESGSFGQPDQNGPFGAPEHSDGYGYEQPEHRGEDRAEGDDPSAQDSPDPSR